MANIAAYSRHKMLAELNDPLFTNFGDGAVPLVYSANEQRLKLRTNIGAQLPLGTAAGFIPSVATLGDANATITVDQLSAGMMVTGALTADRTYTLPTAAQLDTAFSLVSGGSFFDFFLINNDDASNAILAVAAGITNGGVAGNLTKAAGTTGHYRLRKLAVATYTLYHI